MKFILTVYSLIFAIFLSAQSDTSTVSSQIETVTVYFQGAHISRKAKVNLRPGKQILVLNGITGQLNSDRIEVKGEAGITILSVNHQLKKPEIEKNNLALTQKRDKIKTLELRIKTLLNEENVYAIEERLLMENMNFQSKVNGATVTEIRDAADFYRLRLNEIRAAKLKISNDLALVRENIKMMNQEMNKISAGSNILQSQILVSVTCKASFSGNVEFSYFVESAGWEALYDFRVREITDPLQVMYNANVYQSSGEDWQDVSVILSSGFPELSGTAPELNPWYLNRPSQRPISHSPKGRGSISGEITDSQTGSFLPFVNIALTLNDEVRYQTTTDSDGRYSIKPVVTGSYAFKAQYIGYETVANKRLYISANQNKVYNLSLYGNQIELDKGIIEEEQLEYSISNNDAAPLRQQMKSQSLVSNPPPPALQLTPNQVLYTIPTSYTIPSNGEDYLIAIKEDAITADYIYQTIPKYDTDVYLLARIPNWSNLDLLSGNSSIYYQGAYTGDAYVDANFTGDTLQLSLGRDRSIVVSREGIKELNNKRIFGNGVKETVAWELEVRNNKSVPIQIEVLDQFPLSEIKAIEVNRGTYTDAKLDNKTGKLTWLKIIPAATSQKFQFDYELKYPADARIFK